MNPTEQTEAAPTESKPLHGGEGYESLLRHTASAFNAVLGAMHKPPEQSLLAAGTLNSATKPEPGLSTRDAEAALTKLVREFATDIREKGYGIADLKFSPEWQEARALYFLYCNGFEDALYEGRAILAAAVRADKSAWVGDVVLHAWYEYADDGIEKMIAQEQP